MSILESRGELVLSAHARRTYPRTKGSAPRVNALKRVVFVCVENSNRSQIAEAFARIHGAGRVEAFSAGSRPSGRVNPKAIESMRECGYDLEQHRSKSVTEVAGEEFDVAVTMGCGDQCPMIRAKRHEDWQIPDPKNLAPDAFRAVRDMIERKVVGLLERLAGEK